MQDVTSSLMIQELTTELGNLWRLSIQFISICSYVFWCRRKEREWNSPGIKFCIVKDAGEANRPQMWTPASTELRLKYKKFQYTQEKIWNKREPQQCKLSFTSLLKENEYN